MFSVRLLQHYVGTTTATTSVAASKQAFRTMTTALGSTSSTTNIAVGKLHPDSTVLLVCDMQERFRPLAWRMETVVNTTRYMTSVAHALNVPMLATEQYRKVFGKTIPECFTATVADPNFDLNTLLPIFEKQKFSMLTEEVQAKLLQEPYKNRQSFLICGIETHVCVQQTCLDLREQGKDVHVLVDAVTSQQPMDRAAALTRLQAAGCYLTTSQSAAFMLMETAQHPNFKTVSKLTIEHMKLPNEFNQAALDGKI